MSNLVRFILFLLGCAILAAILTPWIYMGVHGMSESLQWPWLKALAKYPFHRYFNRVFQIAILLGIWSLLKNSGLFSLSALGLRAKRSLYLILVGFGTSLL